MKEQVTLINQQGQRVKVDVGAETRVNVTLTPQATESAVDVRSEAPLMQPHSSALAEVINNKQVDALPINGRDYRRSIHINRR